MFSTIVSGLRIWRVSLCGLVAAGFLLGIPFASNPGGQAYAWGKGGKHGSKGHGGSKARHKRHGPKRHHARHHSAKKHRHAKRREHHSHKSHSKDFTYHSTTDITHHRNAWDYYWGHHDYLVPEVVEPDVVAPVVGTPSTVVKKVFIVRLYSPGDQKNHIEEVLGSNHETVKERVREKFADADFKSIREKVAADAGDVYVVKFTTRGDGKDHVEDVTAPSGDKAKEKILQNFPDADVKSIVVKSPADAGDVYVVKFTTRADQQNHADDILALTGDKAKEKILEKFADADVKSADVKPVLDAR